LEKEIDMPGKNELTDSNGSQVSTRHVAMFMWLLLLMLIINISYALGHETGRLLAIESGWRPIAHGVGRALIISLPTILIAMAINEFGLLFWSCGQGDVFTMKNVKTLRMGGDSLVAAALASAIISPTLLDWVDGTNYGFEISVNDLVLGNLAIGLAIHGLANLFQAAVEIKAESDQIV
jgi:hypothetical protein